MTSRFSGPYLNVRFLKEQKAYRCSYRDANGKRLVTKLLEIPYNTSVDAEI